MSIKLNKNNTFSNINNNFLTEYIKCKSILTPQFIGTQKSMFCIAKEGFIQLIGDFFKKSYICKLLLSDKK